MNFSIRDRNRPFVCLHLITTFETKTMATDAYMNKINLKLAVPYYEFRTLFNIPFLLKFACPGEYFNII